MQDLLHPLTVYEELSFGGPRRQQIHIELGNVTVAYLILQDLHLSQLKATLEEAEKVLFKLCQETFLIEVGDRLVMTAVVIRMLIWISTLVLYEELVLLLLHELDHAVQKFERWRRQAPCSTELLHSLLLDARHR